MEIKSYTVNNINEIGQKQNMNFVFIEINKIIFDSGMENKLKEMCNIKGINLGIKTLPNIQGFNLHKFDSVYKNILNNISLDPIIIKSYKNTNYYIIIQGRHRVVASLYYGYNYIPSFIK